MMASFDYNYQNPSRFFLCKLNELIFKPHWGLNKERKNKSILVNAK